MKLRALAPIAAFAGAIALGVGAGALLVPAPAPRPVDDSPVGRLECGRCHASDAVAAWPRERSCVGCHQAILAGDLDATGPLAFLAPLVADRFPRSTTDGWKQRIHSLVDVPSLVGVERRLRREWLVGFLQEPHDLRPGLDATMPRLPIDAELAEAVAEALYGDSPGPPEGTVDGDPTRGAALLQSEGCLGCHAFGGSGLDGRAVGLAPDLRHTRDRMPATTIVAWLEEPSALLPGATMPRPDLTGDERRDLAAAITLLPLDPFVAPGIPEAVAHEGPVAWDDVEARVFKRVCWHCHSSGGAMGDGGPGNTGGFGYAGAGLDLSTRDAVLAGGRNGSVLEPGPTGRPRLVEHLWARHAELAGSPGDVLGMPLGLPPLPPDEIALVEAWIAQGAP